MQDEQNIKTTITIYQNEVIPFLFSRKTGKVISHADAESNEETLKELSDAFDPKPRKIIAFIQSCFENKMAEEIIIGELEKRCGINESDAEWAIEMFRTGMFRFIIISGGSKYPASNIDDAPFLRATIKLLAEKKTY